MVNVWDAATGACKLILQGHTNSVISIDLGRQFADGSALLATGGGDRNACLWRFRPADSN